MSRNDFSSNYLMHHGILGMKWGIRRYQNPDGSLTAAGRERYGVKEGGSIEDISSAKGIKRRLNDVDKAIARNKAKRGKALAKVNSKMWQSQNAKNASKAEKHSEYIKKGEDEINKLLNKADSKGYEITSKNVFRNVSSGGEIIGKTLLNSAIATAVLMPFGRTAVIPSWSSVPGKKYNVKDPKEAAARKEKWDEMNRKAAESRSINAAVEKGLAENKKRQTDGAAEEKNARAAAKKAGLDQGDNWKVYRDAQRGDKKSQEAIKKWESEKKASSSKKSSGLSEKTIKSRVEYAKNTGKFDMEFLERVDRYIDENNHSQAAMLKAYEKYLKEHGDEFYKKK